MLPFLFSFLFLNVFSLEQGGGIFDRACNVDAISFYQWVSKHHCFNIDTADARGYTLFILSIYNQQWGGAHYLARCYLPNFNVQDAFSENTAFMETVFKGYVSMSKWFLDQEANLDIRNYNGASVLIFCVTFGRDFLVHYLLGRGNMPTLRDKWRNIALKYAQMQGSEGMIHMLQA